MDRILRQLKPALIEHWYGGDPFAYVGLCADDVSLFAPGTKGRLEGKTTMRTMYEPAEGKIVVPKVEIVDPELRLFGDGALLTYNVKEFADGGTAPSGQWNATEVYRRSGDEWRIVHAHWSVTQ